MSSIKVKQQGVKSVLDMYGTYQQELSSAIGSVRNVKSNRCMTGRQFRSIYSSLDRIITRLEDEKEDIRNLESGLSDVFNAYEMCENEISGQIKAGTMEENFDSQIKISTRTEDLDSQFMDLIKLLLSLSSKMGISDTAGITNKGISYLESLYQFFTGDKKGLTGAEDLFNLGDKSISLWKGFYDYLKEFYNETGNIFSISNQKKVEKLGLVGDIFGLVSSAFNTADKINNTEGIGTAGIIGEVLNGGNNIVDIWSDIEVLKHMGDTTTNITTTDGLYSPLTFYSTIAKSYLSAFSQGFTSYEKYSADGVWDLGDTGKTGIEFGVTGLYSMLNSLSFGLISEKTTGVSAEEISTGIENWATDVGTGAGNYIVNDPELFKKYNDSNLIGQVAITFYAAFKSCWK